jgi:hypothetical protein
LLYSKALLEKPFQIFLKILEGISCFEKNRNSNNTFLNLFKPMQACLQRKFYKWFILNEVCITKNLFENKAFIEFIL